MSTPLEVLGHLEKKKTKDMRACFPVQDVHCLIEMTKSPLTSDMGFVEWSDY